MGHGLKLAEYYGVVFNGRKFQTKCIPYILAWQKAMLDEW